jgi:glycosyltransferase domain-containing protein
MKEVLTIIIPTHERHHVLKRAIDYYSKIGVNVIIADSSSAPFTIELPETFSYLHCSNCFMGDKIYKALCEVKTKYSCLCADDDFLSESGLSAGYNFLENNSDYVSVQGHFISFDTFNPEEKYNPLYSGLIGYENSSILIEDRLKNCFNAPQIYALHKTINFKKCFEITLGISAVSVVEMCVPLVSLCIGKHKILPVFWEARDIQRYSKYINIEGNDYREDEDHIVNSPPSIVITNWMSYLKSKEGLAFKNNFITTVKDIIPDNLDPSVLFDSAFQEYLSNQKKKKEITSIQKIKNIIKGVLPNILVKRLQQININIGRYLLKDLGGYPFNDKSASTAWLLMINVIKKYNIS